MDKVIVVSDTSVVSNLIQIKQLSLLFSLFSKVFMPPAVFTEISKLSKFDFSLDEFYEAFSKKQLYIQDILDPLDELTELLVYLDKGESEAIILAKEINADLLLMDERLGRKAATKQGIPIIGLLGILRLAKQEQLVLTVKPLLDELRNTAGFWFSDKLYQEVLLSVDE